jgi:L-rhamnose mutarotase
MITACTAARAKLLKISHKALIEELLPKCKEKGATKASIFAEREKLYKKYEKRTAETQCAAGCKLCARAGCKPCARADCKPCARAGVCSDGPLALNV